MSEEVEAEGIDPKAAGQAEAPSVFSGLRPELQRAIADEGYSSPTEIQEQIIPALQEGRDAIGIAQTGTGKTAAFTLPLLQRIAGGQRPAPRRPRALILAPTRELAQQISDSIRTYGRYMRLSHLVIYGGVRQYPQVKTLRRGVDVVVATPGRLLDLIEQGHLQLKSIEIFILDEVDRMLDMGFIEDINRIVQAMPKQRQTMFFSATMPPRTEALAQSMVQDPVRVEIQAGQLDLDRISQKVLFVHRRDKIELLLDLLSDSGGGQTMEKVILFAQTKVMADRLADTLHDHGISSTAIHGDKTQHARAKALQSFKTGRFRVLVATDVAARGLDVDDITHVINYDMPIEAETYVHRIGRTGRAGRKGEAISFVSAGDRSNLRAVEKMLGTRITRDTTHRFHSDKKQQSRHLDSRKPREEERRRSESRKPWENRPGSDMRKPWEKHRDFESRKTDQGQRDSVRGKKSWEEKAGYKSRNAESRKLHPADKKNEKRDKRSFPKSERKSEWKDERKSEKKNDKKSDKKANRGSDLKKFTVGKKKDRERPSSDIPVEAARPKTSKSEKPVKSSRKKEKISRKTRRLKVSRKALRNKPDAASPQWNTGSKAKPEKEKKSESRVTAKGKHTRRAGKRRRPWDDMHK